MKNSGSIQVLIVVLLFAMIFIKEWNNSISLTINLILASVVLIAFLIHQKLTKPENRLSKKGMALLLVCLGATVAIGFYQYLNP
jgi:uncharacterized membrane protein